MKAIEIYNELKDKEQFATECEAALRGISIPQIEIKLSDIEQAIKESPETRNLKDIGFLTSIYMSAAYRLNIDTSEFDNDLFIEFS